MFKRLLQCTGIACGLLVTYFFGQLVWPSGPIRVSKQTTVITEPLADDGLPNYSEYLLDQMREGVTPENNGAIPFLQAMWPAEVEPRYQAALCAEIGMQVPQSDGMLLPDDDAEMMEQVAQWLSELHPGDEYEYEREDLSQEWLEYARQSVWRPSDIPPLVDWLQTHQHEFDLLHQAADCPGYYLPSPTLATDPEASLFMVLLPHQQTLRTAVRCLQIRANHYIAVGDLPAAWRDCRAMYKLGDTPKQEYIVSELISIACHALADQTATRLLVSESLTPELASEIRDFLAKRPLRQNMRGCINEGERLCFVTGVLEMSGQRTPKESSLSELGTPARTYDKVAIDWNVVLEIGNSWYDQLDQAMGEPTPRERTQAMAAVYDRLEQLAVPTPGKIIGAALGRRARSRVVGEVMICLLLPALDQALTAEYRANDQLRLRQVTADLAVYRLEHGGYPDSLAELPPDNCALLLDQLEQPLIYQRTTDGYLLYTQGPNGQDESGSNDILSLFQGYPEPENEADDRTLRVRLGLPAYEPEYEGDYEFLAVPQDADDIAIRVPLIQKPLPKFSPSEDGEF